MTKLTSVKPTTKQLTLIAAALCSVLGFSTPTYAQELKVKTEPLEQRDIGKQHLDVLFNVKKAVIQLSEATKAYSENTKDEKSEFELCADDLCKATRLEESKAAHEAYAKASFEHAEALRDIEINQVQYIIDTMQIKGDSYLASFTDKSDEFFEYFDQILPEIQALNIKSPEDFHLLNSDQQLALEKFGVQLDLSLDDLSIMVQEISVIDNTRKSFETSKQGFHDHANSYELRSDKLNAIAFKQGRRADLVKLHDYKEMSFVDLNTIASTLSNLSGISDESFIPDIDTSSQSGQEVSVIKTKRSGGGFLFDNTFERIENIRNFKRN